MWPKKTIANENQRSENQANLQVDIMGKCGDTKCDSTQGQGYKAADGCPEMINREYKFYLSFENSLTDG